MATPALAQDGSVKITNLTNAIYFTPLLRAAHDQSLDLFEVRDAASPELQAIAEGGDTTALEMLATIVANPAEGLLAPGASAAAELEIGGTELLSIVAMTLPTNDGFVGLDSYPMQVNELNNGAVTLCLYGYHAGSEANDEIVNGGGAPGVPRIPADPVGLNGTLSSGAAGADITNHVHIHRGNIGDDELVCGKSDLDRSVHRWIHPPA
ncbi:MAG: spondin domain-containing protein [Gammaproteobacteria bacterium]|nr:spondin domain-containing protein [Gammaproteobacteria bacterium]MDH3464797.1 spondin domain-containing protein [Gammaproteobacteria bacterium]